MRASFVSFLLFAAALRTISPPANDRGTLEVGKRADLCVWEIDHPAELAYRVGFNPLAYAVKDGRIRQT
jgi:imidazolonepropionase-like amidohydrolase